jgi:hypothetical protein
MDLVDILRELWARRRWLLLVIPLALLAAISTNYRLPSLEKRELPVGAASAQILIDASTSAIADVNRDPGPLASRAIVLAQYMSSPQARTRIARKMGLPQAQVTAEGPFSTLTDRATYQAIPAPPRASQLTDEDAVYRLVFDAQQSLPIISIYTQAPTAAGAIALAGAASDVLTGYVGRLDEGVPRERRIEITELGKPEGGMVNDGARRILAALAFIGVLSAGSALIVIGSGVARDWSEAARSPEADADTQAPAGPRLQAAHEEERPGSRREQARVTSTIHRRLG